VQHRLNVETIAPYTIEEAYEVSEAIDNKDMVSLREELGDLLFQVIFQTKISSEVAGFGFDDVCDDLTRKMVDRHPHEKRAARVGFDWPNLDGVMDKIVEEAQEVVEAAESGNVEAIEDEIGDLLFAVTNLARKLKIDPELALRRTNAKFTKRFKHIENEAAAKSKPLTEMTLDEMETLWQEAKKL